MKGGKGGRKRRASGSGAGRHASGRDKLRKGGAPRPFSGAPRKGSRKKPYGGMPASGDE